MSAGLPVEIDLLSLRVRQVPMIDRAGGDDMLALARSHVLPVLAVAYANRQPLVTAWVRSSSDRRILVFLGPETGLVGSERDGLREVTFPLGARAQVLPVGQARDRVARFGHWVSCEGSFDAPAATEPGLGGGTCDDCFALASRAAAWLVVARPMSRSTVSTVLDELSAIVGESHSPDKGRGSERIRYEQAYEQLRYLERWSALGFWEVEAWAGGESAADALANAALLTSMSDLAALPFRLRPSHGSGATAAGTGWARRQLTSAEVVAALIRPPMRELAGVRMVAPSTFDITPESSGKLVLGSVLDAASSPVGPFGVSLGTLNRHAFITGATGSGKSQTTRRLLDELTSQGLPWLVVEPAKAEYAGMAGRLAGMNKSVTVIRPGKVDEPPASLNPLEPSSVVVDGTRLTFPLQTHLDLVRALFNASFEAQEPFPQILSAALTKAYADLGWNLALARRLRGREGVRPRYPNLADLQRAALEIVEGVQYGREVADNVRGFVNVRIGSLRLGTPGRFFEAGHPLDVQGLLADRVVFEIEDVGDDNDKAFFIGTVFIRLFEALRLLRAHESSGQLRHVLVLEEAHRLLRRADPGTSAARAVEMFANLLAEVRAYGEGIVVVEQIPSKITHDVVKNSALKVMHRLPSGDDRAFVGATMNLDDEQSAMVVGLPPGRAAVHSDGMDRPVLVQVDRSGEAKERVVALLGRPALLRRSPSCSESCAMSPCTLEQIEVSAALASDPRFVLWVELAVVAHVVGNTLGTPDPAFISSVRQYGKDRVRCALGLAVDAAVHGRSEPLQRWYDPAALATHVAETLYSFPAGRPAPCTTEVEWYAGPFRWRPVMDALNRSRSLDEPHPLTDTWAGQGLPLPRTPLAAQVAATQDQISLAMGECDLVLWGTHRAIEGALRRLSPARDLRAAFEQAGRFVTYRADWPLEALFWAE